MAERHTDTSDWWDQSLSRRDVLHGARNVAVAASGIIVGEWLTKNEIAELEGRYLFGPHWPLTDWRRIRREDARDLTWQHFKGNPGLLGFLRLSDQAYNVGMLVADKTAIDARAAQLPASVMHAVAWLPNDGTIEVGALPKGLDTSAHYLDKYIIGMGIQGGDLNATMGLWVPEEERFIVLDGAVTTLPQTTTYRMAEHYPGTVWV